MPLLTAEDGCRIHYEVHGEGSQTLVLVAGLGGDGRFWDDVVPQLRQSCRVVTIDHRGAGRSDRPDGPYALETIAGDVLAVLDALDCPRAHVVGHSTGGAIAQTLALDAPGRVERLVISGSWERSDARFRALFGVRLALVERGLLAEYQQLTHVLGYAPDYLEAHEAALERVVEAAPARLEPIAVTASRIRMLFAFDRLGDLPSIVAPTLVVGAPDDEMVPFHHSRALAAAIPGARLEPCAGGHFFPRVVPARYAALVADHCFPR